MNGEIRGDIVKTAAMYHPDVCELCLNCRHARCINVGDGCDEYREAVRAHTRKRTGARMGYTDEETGTKR